MNTTIPLIIASNKRPFLRSSFIAAGLALASSALVLSNAFGVVPAPDGGYAGGNTAEGQNALLSLTTGGYNTAVGFLSLGGNTDGQFNTGLGAGTLFVNTADQNTATGAGALLSNTEGEENTANGAFALFSNTTGSHNSALGAGALESNTGGSILEGSFNTAAGDSALHDNTTGLGNTALGYAAGFAITAGGGNTAIGFLALRNNTADANTAVGSNALLSNTTGGPNTAVGNQALQSNTISGGNTAMGYQALQSLVSGPPGFEEIGASTAVGFQALANATATNNEIGNDAFGYLALANNVGGGGNVAVGVQALANNISGDQNTAVGNFALLSKVSGDNNVAVGSSALSQLSTGSDNVCVGPGAGFSIINGSGDVCIGSGVEGLAENNTTRIRNIGSTPQGSGLAVTVEFVGGTRLGYVPSSRRYKEDISPMDKASEALFALRPVTFRYKKKIDPTQIPAFGLIAEEVEKVNPDLVAHNPEGQPESVRYQYINAMLLNEFLKEHKAFAEQQDKMKGLQAAVDALARTVKEEAVQIQKMSAQVEVGKSTARVVSNHP